MKPYVSKVGAEWIVINSRGQDAFVTTDENKAFAFFNKNFKRLSK